MFLDTDIKEKVFHQKMPVWSRPLFCVTLLVLLGFLLMLTGCNKHARYQVLNTLFDGVPHPDEALTERSRC